MGVTPKRSFTTGELDPQLYGHCDTTLYSDGVKKLRNFIIRGISGIWNRMGSLYHSETAPMNTPAFMAGRLGRLIEFRYNADLTYLLEFTDQTLRIFDPRALQYVFKITDTIGSITFDLADGWIYLTSTGHGIIEGALIYVTGIVGQHDELNNRYFLAHVTDANTIYLQDPATGAYVIPSINAGTDTVSGTVSSVVQFTTPWTSASLHDLNHEQYGEIVRFTRKGFATMDLTYFSNTYWDLSPYQPGSSTSKVSGLAVSLAGTDCEWTVTAIDLDTNEESEPCAYVAGKLGTTVAPNSVTWSERLNTSYYRIYRRVAGTGGGGQTMGWVADAEAVGVSTPSFSDTGLDPDTSQSPPVFHDPFDSDKLVLQQTGTISPAPASVRCICWHPNGLFFLVGTAVTPYLHAFYRPTLVSAFVEVPINWTIGVFSVVLSGAVTNIVWTHKNIPSYGIPAIPLGDMFAISGDFGSLGPELGSLTFVGVTFGYGNPSVRWGSLWTPDSTTKTLGGVRGLAASPGGNFVAVGSAYSNTLMVLKWNIGKYNEISPLTQPDSTALSCSFSDDGLHLACGHQGTGNLNLYSIAGSAFTYLSGQPATPPSGHLSTVQFSPGSGYLAAGGPSGFDWWKVVGDTFTKLAAPATPPAGQITRVEWDASGSFLSVTTDTSPFIYVYNLVGDTLVFTSNVSPVPTSTVYDALWSPDRKTFLYGQDLGSTILTYASQRMFPAALAGFQQRQLFANNDFKPMGVENSGIGWTYNFNKRIPLTQQDAFRYVIFSQGSEIRHLVSIGPKSLMAMTPIGGIRLTGQNDGTYCYNPPPDVSQTFSIGCSTLQPKVLSDWLVFVQDGDQKIWAVWYNQAWGRVVPVELTKNSGHLFLHRRIVDFAVQTIPDPVVWVVLDDGTLLSGTFDMPTGETGWAHHDTPNGKYRNVSSVRVGAYDRVFVKVERVLNGVTRTFLESFDNRTYADWRFDAHFMDCGIVYDGRNTSTTTMNLNTPTGTPPWAYTSGATLSSSTPYFSTAAHAGKSFRLELNGLAYWVHVVTVTDSQNCAVNLLADIPTGLQAVPTLLWSLGSQTVGNLGHLNGQQVSVYADGIVVASPNNNKYASYPITVTNGKITLSRFYAVIRVGIPFVSDVQLLDIDEANYPKGVELIKNVSRVSLRVQETRGIHVATTYPTDDTTTNMNTSNAKYFDDPTQFVGITSPDAPVQIVTDLIEAPSPTGWNQHGSVFIRQVDPVPVAIGAAYPGGQTT